MKNFLNHSMNISTTLTISINIRFVPLYTILFLFLKYAQKPTETILSNGNQQNNETILNKYYKPIYCSKSRMWGEARGRKKNSDHFVFSQNFWTLLQLLLKATENYANEDTIHHNRIQFAQIYNTFKHQITNNQFSLLHIVPTAITYIMNIPFSSLLLLPSPFSSTRYSNSSTSHQYNNSK